MPEAPIPARIEENSDRRRRWREALLIGVLALTVNLAGNGRTSLWDRDEPRYAGCTAKCANAETGSIPLSTASRAIISRS